VRGFLTHVSGANPCEELKRDDYANLAASLGNMKMLRQLERQRPRQQAFALADEGSRLAI
jgi:hypothetical protein